jgi:uncharacterized protein DUF5906/primase-like protein
VTEKNEGRPVAGAASQNTEPNTEPKAGCATEIVANGSGPRDLVQPIGPDYPLRFSFFDHAEARVSRRELEFRSLDDLYDFASRPEPVPTDGDKKSVSLYSRARAAHRRKKFKRDGTMKMPLAVILDADKTSVPMADALARLELFGVAAVGHTSWSHLAKCLCGHPAHGARGKCPDPTGCECSATRPAHCYRIMTDLAANDWESLEAATRQLLELVGIPVTSESWLTPCFFAPVRARGREGLFRAARNGLASSTWRPSAPKPERSSNCGPGAEVPATDAPQEMTPEAAAEALALLRLALPHVKNADRDDWIRVGMALRSFGAAAGLEDGEARALWDEWSLGQDYPADSDWDAHQELAWESFDDEPASDGAGRVGAATIFYMAGQAGWRAPKRANDPREVFASAIADARAPNASGAAAPPLSRRELLEDLNAQYAYVATGHGMVVDLTPDTAENVAEFKTCEAFTTLYATPKIPTGDLTARGEPIEAGLGAVWLKHWPGRRAYHRVDFLPPGGRSSLGPKTLNLWRGFPHEPGTPLPRGASCERFLSHVREVIAGGDEGVYAWCIAWMAHLVQRPWEKPGVALVLRGPEGIGKGILGETLVLLCGVHGIPITEPTQLTGRFNAHLSGKIFVHADEVTWGGRRADEGVLKGRITERHTVIEAKGVDAVRSRCFARYLVSSNNDWVVPAGISARRFTVLDVSRHRAGDRTYFKAIIAEREAGGLAALIDHLAGVDLSALPDPHVALRTRALGDQKLESLDSRGRWIYSALARGELVEGEGWPGADTLVPSRRLYDSYLQTARETGDTRRAVEAQLSARLEEALGSAGLARFRSRAYSAADLGPALDGRNRKAKLWCYRFPTLERARAAFAEWLGSDVRWGDEGGEPDLLD